MVVVRALEERRIENDEALQLGFPTHCNHLNGASGYHVVEATYVVQWETRMPDGNIWVSSSPILKVPNRVD